MAPTTHETTDTGGSLERPPTSCACTPRSAPRVRSLWSPGAGAAAGSGDRATTAPSSTRKQTGVDQTRPRPGRRRGGAPPASPPRIRTGGVAAVLTNVNDLAAMGATPRAIVDTIVGTADVAREALRDLRTVARCTTCPWSADTSRSRRSPALSAFGRLSRRDPLRDVAAAGQSLVLACCTGGTMRHDFSVLPLLRRAETGSPVTCGCCALARSGACVAAKDVSMAGLVGSLAMLLEWSRMGVTLDLDVLPRPDGCPGRLAHLLPGVQLPALLAGGVEAECLGRSRPRARRRGGQRIDDLEELALRSGAERSTVLDLAATTVTGLVR